MYFRYEKPSSFPASYTLSDLFDYDTNSFYSQMKEKFTGEFEYKGEKGGNYYWYRVIS